MGLNIVPSLIYLRSLHIALGQSITPHTSVQYQIVLSLHPKYCSPYPLYQNIALLYRFIPQFVYLSMIQNIALSVFQDCGSKHCFLRVLPKAKSFFWNRMLYSVSDQNMALSDTECSILFLERSLNLQLKYCSLILLPRIRL